MSLPPGNFETVFASFFSLPFAAPISNPVCPRMRLRKRSRDCCPWAWSVNRKHKQLWYFQHEIWELCYCSIIQTISTDMQKQSFLSPNPPPVFNYGIISQAFTYKHSSIHILRRKTCPCFSLNISFSSHDHCQHQWTATSYFTLEPQQLKCVPTSRPFSRGTVSLANSGQITLRKSCLPYIHPYAKSTVAYSGLNAVSRVPPPQNVMVL